MRSRERIERAIQENAVGAVEAWRGWPNIEFHREKGVTWIESEIPFPVFNFVIRTYLEPNDAPAMVGSLQKQAGERGVPLAWYALPESRPADLEERLEARGFWAVDELSGMAMDLDELAGGDELDSSITIEEVLDPGSLQHWSRITASVFDFPPSARSHWLDLHAWIGLGPRKPYRHFLARVQGRPAGASSVYLGKNAAAICNVATLPELRRRGIGSALTRGPLLRARRLGYRIGVLMSSKMGLSVYRSIGFREYLTGRLYLWAAG